MRHMPLVCREARADAPRARVFIFALFVSLQPQGGTLGKLLVTFYWRINIIGTIDAYPIMKYVHVSFMTHTFDPMIRMMKYYT